MEDWTCNLKPDLQRLLSDYEWLDRVMELADYACNLAYEGHEGKCIGTILVFAPNVGDVAQHLTPTVPGVSVPNLIFSPMTHRAITNLCLADGALVLDGSFNLVSFWQMISAPHPPIALPPVGGAKHSSARALTACCESAVAICISEGGGTVSFFHRGERLLRTGPLFSQRGDGNIPWEQLGDYVGAVFQRNLSETFGTQLTTCPRGNAGTMQM